MILIAFAKQVFPSEVGVIRIISPWPHVSKHPIRERMLQEAIVDNASEASPIHLAAALMGYPNGRVRFDISEAIREENTSERILRSLLLGLQEDFQPIEANGTISVGPKVEEIFSAAGHAPKTIDILRAFIEALPPQNVPLNLSIYRYFVRAVQNGAVLQIA